jgi:hypothetical protein
MKPVWILTALLLLALGFTPAFGGVIVTARTGYEPPFGPPFFIYTSTCSMSSLGDPVGCHLEFSQIGFSNGSSADSSAAFGTGGGTLDVHAGADGGGLGIPENVIAMASASFDEMLVIPGSGTTTIIGHYTFAPSGFPAFQVGSVNQAGTIHPIGSPFGSIFSVTSSIQLGVPFSLTATLAEEAGGSSFPAADIEDGHLVFQNFTDQNGNRLSYGIVGLPEPNLTVLVGITLALFGAHLSRRTRRAGGKPCRARSRSLSLV